MNNDDIFKAENSHIIGSKTSREDIVYQEQIFDHITPKLDIRFDKNSLSYNIEQNDAISFLSRLPDESIDLIVTDPAYSGMNQMLKLGKGKIIGKYSDRGDGQKWFEEFHDTEENYDKLLTECHRVLKNDRHIYIMFDSFSLLSLGPLVRKTFNVKNIVVWDKMNIGMGHYFRRRHEFILFASKGKKNLSLKSIPDVWRIKRITNAKYPTQKPVELFELMLIGSAEPGYTVCDPFMGSGSSAIAALKHNCIYYGCDTSSSSLQVTQERINEYLLTGQDILQLRGCIDQQDKQLQEIVNHGIIK